MIGRPIVSAPSARRELPVSWELVSRPAGRSWPGLDNRSPIHVVSLVSRGRERLADQGATHADGRPRCGWTTSPARRKPRAMPRRVPLDARVRPYDQSGLPASGRYDSQ